MQKIAINALIYFLALILVCHNVVLSTDQIPAEPQKQPIALVGGTIHTVSGSVIENGSILFVKGIIEEIGRNIQLPADALVIDISGNHVFPGLIEANSQLGLTEIDAVGATSDFMEAGSINPSVRAERAINPESERFPITRANGIALAVSKPSGGIISGQAALIMMDGWTWEDMTMKTPIGMMCNWPSMSINAFASKKEREVRKKQINSQIELLEQSIRDARAYHIARMAAGKAGVPFHKTDVRWESMIPVLEGNLPLWIHADRIQEIQAAVEWADREHLKMVLVGGADACRIADVLKAKNIPIIITPILRLPLRNDSDYDEPFTLPLKLYEAGIKYCIAGGSGSGNERNLPYHAAMASAYGLPREEALKAITLHAAEILGIADRVGSLERGKDATLIVTTGDPLEITTQVEKSFIQGRDIDLNNKQKLLYSKYKEKYSRLSAR